MSKKQQEISHRKTGRNLQKQHQGKGYHDSLYTEHERQFLMLKLETQKSKKSSDRLKSSKKTPERPQDKDCLERKYQKKCNENLKTTETYEIYIDECIQNKSDGGTLENHRSNSHPIRKVRTFT